MGKEIKTEKGWGGVRVGAIERDFATEGRQKQWMKRKKWKSEKGANSEKYQG